MVVATNCSTKCRWPVRQTTFAPPTMDEPSSPLLPCLLEADGRAVESFELARSSLSSPP